MHLSRVFAELRRPPSELEREEAVARLRVIEIPADPSVGGGRVLDIDEREGGRPLTDLRDGEALVVRVARGVYRRIPTSEARVALLRRASAAATREVVVHVAIADDRSHLGRALIDAPRRALRAAGVRVAEPGDRFGPARYAHCFFDEEELLGEVDRAGLAIATRRGFSFHLVAECGDNAASREAADSFALEVARVVRLVRVVDAGRRDTAPSLVVAAMRDRGTKTARARGPIGRARLRRAIGWVDALAPRGASCYRRILLEIALDTGAARETVVFGLDVGRTGHVAFEDREERVFDVCFAIRAEPTLTHPAIHPK